MLMGPPHALLILIGMNIKHHVLALTRSLEAPVVFLKDSENAGYSVTLGASNQRRLYICVYLKKFNEQNFFLLYTGPWSYKISFIDVWQRNIRKRKTYILSAFVWGLFAQSVIWESVE